jgi:hypothetical protein
VIVTSGNHDSAIRLSYGLGLFRDRIRMITYPARLDLPVQLEGSDGVRAMVYGVHYLGRGRPRVALADGDKPPPRSHQAVLAKRSPWTASTVRSLQPPSVPLRGPTNRSAPRHNVAVAVPPDADRRARHGSQVRRHETRPTHDAPLPEVDPPFAKFWAEGPTVPRPADPWVSGSVGCSMMAKLLEEQSLRAGRLGAVRSGHLAALNKRAQFGSELDIMTQLR